MQLVFLHLFFSMFGLEVHRVLLAAKLLARQRALGELPEVAVGATVRDYRRLGCRV